MRWRLCHILVSSVLAFAFSDAQAQESLSRDLNLYEQMCSRCLELRTRVEGGEEVSKTEAENTIAFFVEMNRRLKTKEEDMTAAQRRRFKDIGQWFTTGVKPYGPEPVPKLVCEIRDTLKPHFDDALRPHVSECVVSDNQIMQKSSPKYLLVAEFAVPDFSYGLRSGVMGRRFGGYASFRSNFVVGSASYECTSEGTLDIGGNFWASGDERVSNMTVSAGVLCKVADCLDVYAGAGYGRRLLHWQDIDGDWAEVSDWSLRGAAYETGLLLSFGRFTLSAGVSTILFRSFSMTFGVGINLFK